MSFLGRTVSGLLGFVLLAALAAAQQAGPAPGVLPEAPSSVSVTPAVTQPASQSHAFWDHKNAWLFSGVAVFRVLDYTSTRNMRDRGRQEILLTNWVVDNKPLFIGIEAAATGLSVGLSYVMHRTAHHKVERLISIGHISGAAFGDARNYALKSGHHYPVQ
ncbi:MAG TPA: hypothetical protein VJN48_02290 [Terriglobales bacterium]|nr:hypothetical protein [Terriglobales bacterium]